MDERTLLGYFEEKKRQYSTFGCDRLLQLLNFNEYYDREQKKTDLFFKRLDFICMAESLKIAMARETRYKQIKRYLKTYRGMDDVAAQHNADKINQCSRIYKKFSIIVRNCAQCFDMDIRDLTIKELSLAVNLSWVFRRSVLTKPSKKVPVERPIVVDQESVQQSVDEILSSRWYSDAKKNPALVANIMNRISERIVNSSLYAS